MLHVLSLFFITSTSAVSIRAEAQRHLVSLCIESRTVQNGVDTFRRVLELPWKRVNFPNEFTHAVHETHILSGAFNLERTQQTQRTSSVNAECINCLWRFQSGSNAANTTKVIGEYFNSWRRFQSGTNTANKTNMLGEYINTWRNRVNTKNIIGDYVSSRLCDCAIAIQRNEQHC